MGDTTISWTEKTWNPIRAFRKDTSKRGWFCTKVTAACDGCYAETMNMKAGASGGTGLPYKPGHLKDVDIRLVEEALLEPLSWQKGMLVFPLSMSDLFGDWVTGEMLERIFAVMALSRRHTYQVLTKRPKRMREWINWRHTPSRVTAQMFQIMEKRGKPITRETHPELFDAHGYATVPVQWPLPNVWAGASICHQPNAEDFVPELLGIHAALHFVSAAPLLGEIKLRDLGIQTPEAPRTMLLADYVTRHDALSQARPTRIGWVLTEGESGKDARPTHPEWLRRLRDDCAAARVPFHHKQNGEFIPENKHPLLTDEAVSPGGLITATFTDGQRMHRVGLKKAGRLLDGVTHDAFPEVA